MNLTKLNLDSVQTNFVFLKQVGDSFVRYSRSGREEVTSARKIEKEIHKKREKGIPEEMKKWKKEVKVQLKRKP